MTYAAFVDVLGFSETVGKRHVGEISSFLSEFVSCAETVRQQYIDAVSLFSVSDSLVVFSNDATSDALTQFCEYLWRLFREEFKGNGILLRGGISKGEFVLDANPDEENNSLNILGGYAYMKAYRLERQYKASCLIIDNAVLEDIEETQFDVGVVKAIADRECSAAFPINVDFLLGEKTMKKYIDSAAKSEWIPHYYNTLASSMAGQADSRKGSEIIDEIVSELKQGSDQQTWRKLDTFLEKAFSSEVDVNFKRRLLRYIRHNLP